VLVCHGADDPAVPPEQVAAFKQEMKAAGDLDWLQARGVEVRFRASLETDLAAFEAFKPDLAIGTTPVVQKAKAAGTPALYFTNLISARPLMGPAGAGSLAQVVGAALTSKPRFDEMKAFFEGVGSGDTAGVWEDVPDPHEAFRAKQRRKRALAAKRAADLERPVGC